MDIKLSVLIPMYNEEKNVENTARTLKKYFDGKFPAGEYEIVFCNDGSRDGSAEIIVGLDLPNIRLVGYPDNRGKGSAVREGVARCLGDIIVYTDCDLAYGCDAIYGIYSALLDSGSDITIGSRNMSKDGYEGYSFLRKLMSKTYIKVISLFAGFKFSDSQCGIKCLRRDSAREIFSKCTVNGFAFDLEMLILAEKLKKNIKEYPVHIINHDDSDSKVNPIKDSLKMIRDVIRIKKIHKNV